LHGTVTRLWSLRGVTPEAPQQMDFDWTFLWGVVNPATGEHFGLVLPEVNTEMATLFFQQFSAHLEPGRHAVVLLDGAGWHGERCVAAAPNVTLLLLPPYSPQLNPIERLWRWIKKNFLANRVFETLEALIDRLCEAWRSLTPDLIQTLCRAEWINGQE
jgi:transposase